MSKYIDADRLKAEITDLCANANFHQQKAMEESNREDFVSSGGEIFAYAKVLSIITSLQQEQPEVDLKKEIDDELDRNWRGYYIEYRRFAESAKHFYELGLNARKQ